MQPKGNPATKMNWRTTCADRAVCCAEHAAAWYSVPTPERIRTVQQHGHRDQHAGHRRHRGHHLRRQGGGGQPVTGHPPQWRSNSKRTRADSHIEDVLA